MTLHLSSHGRLTGCNAILSVDRVRVSQQIAKNLTPLSIAIADVGNRRLKQGLNDFLPAHPEMSAPVLPVLLLRERIEPEHVHQDIALSNILIMVCFLKRA